MDPRLSAARRAVRRRLLWHRRPLAAVSAALAVLLGFGAYKDAQRGVLVVVAARDLPAGAVLTAGDVVTVPVPPGAAADGAASSTAAVVGERLSLPMRRHEPVTDLRLLNGRLLGRLGVGMRAVPVRIADRAAADVVTAGSVVDVYARNDGGIATAAVSGATVLRVLAADDQGVVLLLAVDDPAAARLSAAAGAGVLSIAVRAPP